jgi:hypothetical protein
MSDYSSDLPVRSNLPGQVNPDDVIVKLGDATNPTTQQAMVDTHGSQYVVNADSAGNLIGDQQLSSTWWLQVVTPTNGSASPGTSAAFSELIGGQYNTTLPTLTNGQQSAIQVNSHGVLLVSNSNFPLTVDTNYGTVGANTIRTAAQIGNATGAADFNFGTVGPQTLRVASEIGNATGSASFNYGAVTAQTIQTAAQLGNATGAIDYNWGTVDAQTIRTAAEIGNATGAANFNYGTVTAQTLQTAAQIGNATGAADFGAGATDAQTLRVTANQGVPNTAANAWPISITSGGALNSPTNPIFVNSSDTTGTSVDNYQTSAALAANASVNQDYTVSASVSFYTKQIWASASGKLKIQVEYETASGSGIFNTFWVGFNSTANPDILIPTPTNKIQVTGARIRIVLTNLDKAAMDVYSTLSGTQQ